MIYNGWFSDYVEQKRMAINESFGTALLKSNQSGKGELFSLNAQGHEHRITSKTRTGGTKWKFGLHNPEAWKAYIFYW